MLLLLLVGWSVFVICLVFSLSLLSSRLGLGSRLSLNWNWSLCIAFLFQFSYFLLLQLIEKLFTINQFIRVPTHFCSTAAAKDRSTCFSSRRSIRISVSQQLTLVWMCLLCCCFSLLLFIHMMHLLENILRIKNNSISKKREEEPQWTLHLVKSNLSHNHSSTLAQRMQRVICSWNPTGRLFCWLETKSGRTMWRKFFFCKSIFN